MRIYSGVFFPNGLHMTWDYNPGECRLPKDIIDGSDTVVGIYGAILNAGSGVLAASVNIKDGIIDADEAVSEMRTKQYKSENPLHISLYWRTSPVVCGNVIKSAIKNKDLIPVRFTMVGKWGFHRQPVKERLYNDRI